MVRLRASAKIKKLHYEQQMSEWRQRKQGHIVGVVLSRGRAPEDGIDEQVWRNELLPHLQEPPPGERPATEDHPDDLELWYRAWRHTYEETDSSKDSDASSESADSDEWGTTDPRQQRQVEQQLQQEQLRQQQLRQQQLQQQQLQMRQLQLPQQQRLVQQPRQPQPQRRLTARTDPRLW